MALADKLGAAVGAGVVSAGVAATGASAAGAAYAQAIGLESDPAVRRFLQRSKGGARRSRAEDMSGRKRRSGLIPQAVTQEPREANPFAT